MTIVGVDAHKLSHTLVAVDDSGRKLAEKVSTTNSSGHLEAIRLAQKNFGRDLLWAVEDCRHVSRRLEQDLMMAGYSVVRVPTRLMARTRASARTAGKSDPIDALAVARAALREPGLPTASHDEASRELKLLVDRREDLLGQRTATINRLLWRLHELDPEHVVGPSALSYKVHRAATSDWLKINAAWLLNWLATSWPRSLACRKARCCWRNESASVSAEVRHVYSRWPAAGRCRRRKFSPKLPMWQGFLARRHSRDSPAWRRRPHRRAAPRDGCAMSRGATAKSTPRCTGSP